LQSKLESNISVLFLWRIPGCEAGDFFVLYQEILRQKYRIKERAILINTQAKENKSNFVWNIDTTQSKIKRK
jgi:hypothetical protein